MSHAGINGWLTAAACRLTESPRRLLMFVKTGYYGDGRDARPAPACITEHEPHWSYSAASMPEQPRRNRDTIVRNMLAENASWRHLKNRCQHTGGGRYHFGHVRSLQLHHVIPRSLGAKPGLGQ